MAGVSATKANPWKRLIHILLFIVIFGIAEWVTYVIVLVQFLSSVFTGKSNDRLRELGQNIAVYAQQIISFLTYASDAVPYPFSPWPGNEIPTQPLNLEPPPASSSASPASADRDIDTPSETPVDLGKPTDTEDSTPDANDQNPPR